VGAAPEARQLDQALGGPEVASAVRRLGAEVINGLRFDTDEEWMKACYRDRGITEARQQAKQEAQRQAETAEQPKVAHCSFCGEPASVARKFITADGREVIQAAICEACVADTAKIIAAKRAGAEAATP
jgi:hypothetical protein